MEARQIILEVRNVKLLADTVEAPKVKGTDRMGQPILETFSTDTTRKILQAGRELCKPIQDYIDRFDAIVETAEEQFRALRDTPEDNQEALDKKQRDRAALQTKTNKEVDDLQKGAGRQEVAVYVNETVLQFIRGRFDDREDLRGNREMLERIVAISDALTNDNAKKVDLPDPKPVGDDRNGKPALELVKGGADVP